jgi:hypothetical protein
MPDFAVMAMVLPVLAGCATDGKIWPAWEVNFIWKWVDHIMDSPLRAYFSYALLACAVLSTHLGLKLVRITH